MVKFAALAVFQQAFYSRANNYTATYLSSFFFTDIPTCYIFLFLVYQVTYTQTWARLFKSKTDIDIWKQGLCGEGNKGRGRYVWLVLFSSMVDQCTDADTDVVADADFHLCLTLMV